MGELSSFCTRQIRRSLMAILENGFSRDDQSQLIVSFTVDPGRFAPRALIDETVQIQLTIRSSQGGNKVVAGKLETVSFEEARGMVFSYRFVAKTPTDQETLLQELAFSPRGAVCNIYGIDLRGTCFSRYFRNICFSGSKNLAG